MFSKYFLFFYDNPSGYLAKTFLKILLAVFFASISAFPALAAVDPQMAVGTTTVQAGANAVLPINFTAGTIGVSALNFDLSLPSGITFVSASAGAAATAAAKSVVAATVSGGVRVLVYGMNQNIINSGALAQITLNVSAGLAAGQYAVSPTGLVASDIDGYDVAFSGQAGSLTVTGGAPPDTIAPTIPTGLSATAQSSSAINISWNASTDNVGVTGYRIYRGGAQVGTSAANSYSDTGLSASTAYTYTVSAYDSAGNVSAQSASAGATTQSGGTSITMGETNILPAGDSGNANLLLAQSATLLQTATVQSLSFYVAAAAGKLRLGIYDATGPGSGPGAKKAETNEITPIVGWNTANVITPVSLTAGAYWLAYLPNDNNLQFRRDGTGSFRYYSYTYGVMPAVFSTSPTSGVDHWSFYATLLTSGGGDTVAPSVPTNLSAAAVSTSQINLSWTASTDNVGVTGYRIYRGGNQIATVTSGTTYQNTGLTASTAYSYTISAYDAAGNNSAQSSSVSATTLSGVPVPGDFNSDHIVNSLDYSLLNSRWYQTTNISLYDLQIDGIINSLDYAIFKDNWGKAW